MSDSLITPVRRTRAEINRENAKKSTGPKTPEGKAASSKNAFKHGFYSKEVCIPGEDPAGLDALCADLRAEHQPATPTEELLVDELAQHYWRMKRYRYFESSIWMAEERGEDGKLTANLDRVVWTIQSGIAPFYHRALASAERAFYKALNALRQAKRERGFVFASDSQSLPAAPESDANSNHSGFVPQVSTAVASEAAMKKSAASSEDSHESLTLKRSRDREGAVGQFLHSPEAHAVPESRPSLPDISGFVSTKTSSTRDFIPPAQLFKDLQAAAGFTPAQIQAALASWRKES